MKKVLIGLALMYVMAAPSAAASLLNFGEFFSSVRAGYVINQHGEKSEIFYTPVQVFHNRAGVEFVSINAGYESEPKRPALSLGVRADNIIPLIWGGEWGKAHVTTAKLPTLEFGPYVSTWPKGDGNLWHLDFWYGLSVAVGF